MTWCWRYCCISEHLLCDKQHYRKYDNSDENDDNGSFSSRENERIFAAIVVVVIVVVTAGPFRVEWFNR